MRHPVRIELTDNSQLAELSNHTTMKDARH